MVALETAIRRWANGARVAMATPSERAIASTPSSVEHARLIEKPEGVTTGQCRDRSRDIGTVGCWGEWNTALPVERRREHLRSPSVADANGCMTALTDLIDHHLSAFSGFRSGSCCRWMRGKRRYPNPRHQAGRRLARRLLGGLGVVGRFLEPPASLSIPCLGPRGPPIHFAQTSGSGRRSS